MKAVTAASFVILVLLDGQFKGTEAVIGTPSKPVPEVHPSILRADDKISTAVGVGVAQGGSISFTGLDGECVSRSFGTGSAGTKSAGDAQASIGGNVSSQSGCGEDSEPFDIGFSGFGGFVTTQSVQTDDDCKSNTAGFGNVNTVTIGNIDSSAIGGLGGQSSCGRVARKILSSRHRSRV